MRDRTAAVFTVIKRGITDNLFAIGGGESKRLLFPHLLRSSDIKEMKGLVEGIFNPVGSRKVVMFISFQCGLNTLKWVRC